MRIEKGEGWELRLGDFREVLADVERVDHVICDPPYLGASLDGGSDTASWAPRSKNPKTILNYQPASLDLLSDLVRLSERRSRLWFVCFNDFDGTAFLRSRCKERGAVTAEPIGWLKPPSLTPPRGGHYLPMKGTEFITAARWTRCKAGGRWLPGGYASPRNTAPPAQLVGVTGGKPLPLMRAIVRDFTEPGDLICDPTAGWATTLRAAVLEGRRAIGAEIDPETFDKAVARLREPRTMNLFGEGAA